MFKRHDPVLLYLCLDNWKSRTTQSSKAVYQYGTSCIFRMYLMLARIFHRYGLDKPIWMHLRHRQNCLRKLETIKMFYFIFFFLGRLQGLKTQMFYFIWLNNKILSLYNAGLCHHISYTLPNSSSDSWQSWLKTPNFIWNNDFEEIRLHITHTSSRNHNLDSWKVLSIR